MKNIFRITIIALCLSSCAAPKTLYTWEKYHQKSYNYLKNSDEKSIQELINTYQVIISKQKGSRKTVPPGIYADYGFLLIQTDKVEEGKKMLQMEIALYPESAVFIEQIIKTLEK